MGNSKGVEKIKGRRKEVKEAGLREEIKRTSLKGENIKE